MEAENVLVEFIFRRSILNDKAGVNNPRAQLIFRIAIPIFTDVLNEPYVMAFRVS